METLSVLLAFPLQKPVTQSFDVFFDLHTNRRISKQSRRQWFETPSRLLWRRCYGEPMSTLLDNLSCLSTFGETLLYQTMTFQCVWNHQHRDCLFNSSFWLIKHKNAVILAFPNTEPVMWNAFSCHAISWKHGISSMADIHFFMSMLKYLDYSMAFNRLPQHGAMLHANVIGRPRQVFEVFPRHKQSCVTKRELENHWFVCVLISRYCPMQLLIHDISDTFRIFSGFRKCLYSI